jgi:hypothetical protein
MKTEGLWLWPAVKENCQQLINMAIAANEELKREKNKEKDKMGPCVRTLRRLFGDCQASKAALERSKKLCALNIMIKLFWIYFKLYKYQDCEKMINIAEGPMWPDLQVFPNADYVAFKYYSGRMALFDSKFKQSETDLEIAFQRCPSFAQKNIA